MTTDWLGESEEWAEAEGADVVRDRLRTEDGPAITRVMPLWARPSTGRAATAPPLTGRRVTAQPVTARPLPARSLTNRPLTHRPLTTPALTEVRG